MFGSAQRHSQFTNEGSQGFSSSQHVTPFKHPSVSMAMNTQQIHQSPHHSQQMPVYGCYSSSVGSTNLASQFNIDASQGMMPTQGLNFGSSKVTNTKAGPSNMGVTNSQRVENKAKSEKFFRELQQLFSNQLDRIKDDISSDLRHFKDVDENIKRSMGLSIGNLSEDISSLKDDLKNAVKGYTKKVEECFKEQELEVSNLCKKIKKSDTSGAVSKKNSSQTMEDNLASTFQFLTHEIKELQDQMSTLRSQMKTDTEFAIERIKDVKTQYIDEFSKHAERQHLINLKVIDYLDTEKKKNEAAKMARKQAKISQKEEKSENMERSLNVSRQNAKSIRAEIAQASKPTLDIEYARPKTDDDIKDAIPIHRESKLQRGNSGTSVSTEKRKCGRPRKWIKDLYTEPVECLTEVSDKLSYLRKSAVELENEERARKRLIRGAPGKLKVDDPTNPRDARSIMRRLALECTDELELRNASTKEEARVIVNKAQEAAKIKARELYGPKIANLLIQTSTMISKASKGVGMMRGRVAISTP